MESSISISSPDKQNFTKNVSSFFIPLLIVLGSGISTYLYYRHLILLEKNTLGKPDICSTVFGKGCDGALSSNFSTILGLPIAGWGIIYFFLLFILLFIPKYFSKGFVVNTRLGAAFIALIGCGCSISLLSIMVFNTALFCPFCVVIHLINIFLFFLLKQTTGFSFKEILLQPLKWVSMIFSKNGFANSRIFLLGLGTLILITIILHLSLQLLARKYKPLKDGAVNVKSLLSSFYAQPKHTIPIDKDDPVSGPVESRIELIVFSDFQCPSCKYFSLVLAEIDKSFKGKYHIVFKHFPLGSACNSSVEKNKDIHPRSCEAASAAEAARKQGKFWQFHDSLFATDLNKGDKTVCTIAAQIGLDHQQFESDRTSELTRQTLGKNVAQAQKLGVDGTPAVFLNGRLVRDFRLNKLQILMMEQYQSILPILKEIEERRKE